MRRNSVRAGALVWLVFGVCAMPLAAQRAGQGKARTSTTLAPKIRFASGTDALDIPFELYANVIFLRARVNGSEPLSFIFDTGAGINVVNASRAAGLSLARASGGVTAKGTGGTVEGTLATGATVALPGVEAFGQRIAVLPLDSLEPHVGRRVDGILGYDFIKQFVVEIDYERKTISFHDPRTYQYRGRGAIIPVGLRGGTPFITTTVDLSAADSVTGEFEIDTGSDGALGVYDYFVRARALRQHLPRMSAPQKGMGVGGETSSVEARVKDFRVGRFRIENPVISLSEDDNEEGGARPKYDGMIGTEVFRRFKVVIDYARSRLILESNKFFAEPYETDMSGVDLVAGGEDFHVFRVTRVETGSPGAEAGLRAGDVLARIDGRDAATFTLDAITRLFTEDGRVCALTVRRGAETVETQIKLRRRI
ncbi:MAG: aspartyl protease family protein [Pyrinomonadaceae bacterium]